MYVAPRSLAYSGTTGFAMPIEVVIRNMDDVRATTFLLDIVRPQDGGECLFAQRA